MLKTFTESNTNVLRVDFNPAEFMMATLYGDGRIRFHDLQSLDIISTTPPILESTAKSFEFHPDGHELLVACHDSLQVFIIYICNVFINNCLLSKRYGHGNRPSV